LTWLFHSKIDVLLPKDHDERVGNVAVRGAGLATAARDKKAHYFQGCWGAWVREGEFGLEQGGLGVELRGGGAPGSEETA
jgi:hypothetical protein